MEFQYSLRDTKSDRWENFNSSVLLDNCHQLLYYSIVLYRVHVMHHVTYKLYVSLYFIEVYIVRSEKNIFHSPDEGDHINLL